MAGGADVGDLSAPLRIVVAQRNMTVGDIAGNVARIKEALAEARGVGADLAVLPELAVTGYPPEDLLLRPSFVAASVAAVEELAAHSEGLTAVVGFVEADTDLYNAAAVLHDGALVATVRKRLLPNYSVFDERRYFRPGESPALLFRARGARLGVTVCEDMWHPNGPAADLAMAGADILVNISASPYAAGKPERRRRMFATRALDHGAIVVLCNMVGGQDELVFDGSSAVLGPDGRVVGACPSFVEATMTLDVRPLEARRRRWLDPRHRGVSLAEARSRVREVDLPTTYWVGERATLEPPAVPTPLGEEEELYQAVVLGVRDYARKNGFADAVIGLSGGIDSSLTASVAVDALGPGHVTGVAMPTRYSSDASLSDAQALCRNIGIRLLEIPIDAMFQQSLDALAPHLEGPVPGVTQENLQPRLRGMVLMALSNAYGHLVLTTGNKSETSVGFATLYGDTAGGFAPLKDLFKTKVYALSRWRNARQQGEWIPEAVLSKAPSPELKPNQTDQDVLPPYEELDPILEAYVESERSIDEIVAEGHAADVVRWVASRVDKAEYKRRQSPPGVKLTDRAFGRDRRMPITKGGGAA